LRSSIRLRLAALLILAVTSSACQAQPSDLPSSSPKATPDPIPSAALAEAIRFRSEFGLRADDAYVREVFADPSATSDFGVPLLPAELIELRRRASAAADVARVVRTYGATVPDTYAGEYIDAATGNVYGLFTADVFGARAAITAQLSPLAQFTALPARFTLQQLTSALADAGSDETQAWLRSIGAPLRSGSVRISDNVVRLVLGGMPADVDEISRRLGVDRSMLVIFIDPDTLANLPRGSIRGLVVDAQGNPVTGRNLDVTAVGDVGNYEPDGGTGISTDLAGAFEIERAAAMGWTVTISDPLTGAVVGTTHTVVVGGQATVIRIMASS
jgi:hypothetical protein